MIDRTGKMSVRHRSDSLFPKEGEDMLPERLILKSETMALD